MKTALATALALALPMTLPAETADPILAMGAYVATDDMDGSRAFYGTLFDRAPVIDLADFVAFDVSGGWFAIVSRDRYAPDAKPGAGAVPYLQASDLTRLQARAANTGLPVPAIIEEPGIRLLKLTDPNGHRVEFFTLTGQ